jgi:hypothetical protein
MSAVGALVGGLRVALSGLAPEYRHNLVCDIANDILNVRVESGQVADLERQHRHRAKAAGTASTKA